MQTITIDILNDKAIKLIEDMELRQLIKMRKNEILPDWNDSAITKLKGAMTKQSLTDIDAQLNELRNSWE